MTPNTASRIRLDTLSPIAHTPVYPPARLNVCSPTPCPSAADPSAQHDPPRRGPTCPAISPASSRRTRSASASESERGTIRYATAGAAKEDHARRTPGEPGDVDHVESSKEGPSRHCRPRHSELPTTVWTQTGPTTACAHPHALRTQIPEGGGRRKGVSAGPVVAELDATPTASRTAPPVRRDGPSRRVLRRLGATAAPSGLLSGLPLRLQAETAARLL